MTDEKILNSDFYLQFPFRELLREQMEVIGANPHGLLLWYRGRTTGEFEFDGLRCGGVLGARPLDHSKTAEDLSRCGMPCTARQVRRWDRRLAQQGAIARVRTPVGYRVLVMDSFKFADDRVNKLPAWAHEAVSDAAARRPDRTPKNRDSHLAAIQSRASVTDQKVAVRPPQGGDPYINTTKTQEKNPDARASLAFSSGQLKITRQEDEAFRDAFRHVDFPAEYQRMATWLVANPQRIKKPGKFVYRWLANIPVPAPEPAGMDIPTAEAAFRG